jgi:Arc/MetJ-type ribon-helix-helix transcriptional regulator
MPKISVEIPAELLADLDEHVGDDGKFVNRSDAVRASIRKTLDVLDEIDARHGRLTDERGTAGPSAVETGAAGRPANGTDAGPANGTDAGPADEGDPDE